MAKPVGRGIRNDDPFCSSDILKETLFYATKWFYVLYDIRPVLPGHILIIPKRHVVGITQLTRDESAGLHRLLKMLIPKMTRLYKSDGSYNIMLQTGAYSGMSIRHMHIHFIPRNRGDRYQIRNNTLYVDLERNRKGMGKKFVESEVKRLRKAFRYKAEL